MEKKGLPIVLLLGAKGQHASLDAVPVELNKIHNTLFPKQGDEPAFELVHLPYFTRSDINQTLDQLKNRIAVLHFAGHSNDQGLVTDGVEKNYHTSTDDPELVYSRHICKHIRSWSQAPTLLFLNGCRNAAQVTQFHQAGVAVVVATHRPINDGKASAFAQAFYRSLFSDSLTSLHAAFEQAGANTLSENRGVRSCDIDEIDDADTESLDWSPYPQHAEQLNWTLVELLTNERPVLDANGQLINPYKGLEAFQQQDKAWFFGREQLTIELAGVIPTTPFYTLMGASGSGKSSLINAGVVPALEESGEYLILQCRPGAAPFEELAQALALVLYPDVVERIPKQKALVVGLQAQDIHLLDLVPALLQKSGSTRLCLMVDQFEELFTQSRDQQDTVIQPYITQLVALIEADTACTLALIMRADFLTAAMAYTDFAKLINDCPHTLLPPMSRAELRAAIERPAAKQHVQLEPALTEALLDAVDNQAGSLPLLQYVLSLLWEKRDGRVIRLDDYNAFGGLEKALERRADEIFQGFTPREQVLCKQVFLRLVQMGDRAEDTRRRADLSREFNSEDRAVIKVLTDTRLVTTSDGDDKAYAEISHEALINYWERLKGWVTDNRVALKFRRQLIFDSKRWNENKRNKDYLLSGSRLQIADEWREDRYIIPSDLERDFIKESLKQEKRGKSSFKSNKKSLLILAIILFYIYSFLIFEEAKVQAEHLLEESNLSMAKLLSASDENQIEDEINYYKFFLKIASPNWGNEGIAELAPLNTGFGFIHDPMIDEIVSNFDLDEVNEMLAYLIKLEVGLTEGADKPEALHADTDVYSRIFFKLNSEIRPCNKKTYLENRKNYVKYQDCRKKVFSSYKKSDIEKVEYFLNKYENQSSMRKYKNLLQEIKKHGKKILAIRNFLIQNCHYKYRQKAYNSDRSSIIMSFVYFLRFLDRRYLEAKSLWKKHTCQPG